MYNLLPILAGIIISTMMSINGGLSANYGTYTAAVIIHLAGVLFAGVLCIMGRKHIQGKRQAPLWAYLGGAIGVLTVLFNNFAFGQITMTSIVALGLLGQSLASVVLDSCGWLGVPKRRAGKHSAVGYLAAIIGICIMMDKSVSVAAAAVILSLFAGVTVVFSRTVNARLAADTGPLMGSFFNHLVGLPICIVLALSLQRPILPPVIDAKPWMYLGGVLGVVTVLLFNITVPKIPAFRLTLLAFIGQVFAGIALDFALGLNCSTSTFAGGIVIAGGLLVNMLLEQWSNYKKHKSRPIL